MSGVMIPSTRLQHDRHRVHRSGNRIIPKYQIRCVGGGEIVKDLAALNCPDGHDSLLRVEYLDWKLNLSCYTGIFRYLCWLPVESPLLPSGGPVTFMSKELNRELGLKNLLVSFSGYFPEQGANLTSCSFKELEALVTLQRMKDFPGKIPVIASAGNTGRAFAEIATRFCMPVVIVVPEKAVSRLWTTEEPDNVFLVAVKGDYSDAILVSGTLAAISGCIPEGGAKNVARRDAMGTVMLDAAVTAGRMPDYYFQAVGSGTGGISAWEAALRLKRDGRFGTKLPQLHLAQNEPFVPMVSAWRDRRREINPDVDMPHARECINQVMSDMLTNRNPPYGIRGGLFDALLDTNGVMYTVSNTAGNDAMKLISDTIGIDLDPAAAVATAALVQAVESGSVTGSDHILLNLTGGGYKLVKEDYTLNPIEPAIVITVEEPKDSFASMLKEWITHYG
jgi:cysteate synthase